MNKFKSTWHLNNSVCELQPSKLEDDRGFFSEIYNNSLQNILKVNFVQDNLSKSHKHVLRGIHYQSTNLMGKLCRVIKGGGFEINSITHLGDDKKIILTPNYQ